MLSLITPLLAALGLSTIAPPQSTVGKLQSNTALEHRHVWIENGLSLGVDLMSDLPDVIVDMQGRRLGIVDRHRAAFELTWVPRLAYSFSSGLTLGLYGGLGFAGPSTPQMAIMIDRKGLHVERNRDRETGYALTVMGGTFVGVRKHVARGHYVLPTLGVHWRGRDRDGLKNMLMVDLRLDTGIKVGTHSYVAVGPEVRMAALSWGLPSHTAIKDVSFNLIATFSHAIF